LKDIFNEKRKRKEPTKQRIKEKKWSGKITLNVLY
jgi:hypothetical protein